jgi:hypothetical protein
MPKLIWDEEYWRHCAEEARSFAVDIRHPECKRIMDDIAKSYDRLAELSLEFRGTAVEAFAATQQQIARVARDKQH